MRARARALVSPLAGLAIAALLIAFVVLDTDRTADPTHGQAHPQRDTSATARTGRPTTPLPIKPVARMADVPPTLAQRQQLHVLTDGCRYSARGIPSCGTLLGAAYGSNTDPTPWEQSMGHTLGVHRTYFLSDEVGEAVDQARVDLAAGRVPWISFKVPYSWAEMAAGQGDAWAQDIAQQLAQLDGPVWIAFHHEPEKGQGDIADWTAMQDRLAPIVRQAAPNVAYSVILTGWNQLYGPGRYSLAAIWPHAKIDLVGFDVYNMYGVVRHGYQIMERTRFEASYFSRFQRFAAAHDVAWGLSETGYTDASAQVEPDFVQRLYRGVQDYGGVAIAYFNSDQNSIAPWRLDAAKEGQFAAAMATAPTL